MSWPGVVPTIRALSPAKRAVESPQGWSPAQLTRWENAVPGEIVASVLLYLGGAAAFRLVAFSTEPNRWWHPVACLLWPLSVVAVLAMWAWAWIIFGDRV
jgi:hypothetical protein